MKQDIIGFRGWQWHQLDHMQTICTSLQTDNRTNISKLNFYRPDARRTSSRELEVTSGAAAHNLDEEHP